MLVNVSIAGIEVDAMEDVFLGAGEGIAIFARDKVLHAAEGDLVGALIEFGAYAVDDAGFRNLDVGGFAVGIGGILPGVVEGSIDAVGYLLAQQELVIVGLGETLAAGEEVGRVEIAEVGVGDGGFVEVEVLRSLDEDASTVNVTVVVVGSNFAGGAAVDVEAAPLSFDTGDRFHVKIEAADVEGPAAGGSLFRNLLRTFVGGDGYLLLLGGLVELALEALLVAAPHEVGIGPVEILAGGGMEGNAVMAGLVELELAVNDTALLALVVLVGIVGVEGAPIAEGEVHLLQVDPAIEAFLKACLRADASCGDGRRDGGWGSGDVRHGVRHSTGGDRTVGEDHAPCECENCRKKA